MSITRCTEPAEVVAYALAESLVTVDDATPPPAAVTPAVFVIRIPVLKPSRFLR